MSAKSCWILSTGSCSALSGQNKSWTKLMLTRRAYNKGAFVYLFIFHLLIPSYTHTYTDKCSLRNFHFHFLIFHIFIFSLSYIEKFILQTTFSTDTRIPKCHTLVPRLTRPRGSARSTFYPQVQWSPSFNRALSQLSRKGNVMGILQPLPCMTVIRNTERLSQVEQTFTGCSPFFPHFRLCNTLALPPFFFF